MTSSFFKEKLIFKHGISDLSFATNAHYLGIKLNSTKGKFARPPEERSDFLKPKQS